jgi:adenine-specific DNA-methyltransferase
MTMAKQLQKLELTWIGKGEEPKLEPRILIEDPSKSYGDPHTENMLIHGDNLLALKALEYQYNNSVKCIYIDPPYNTGNAFEYYDDGLEHSLWLNLMKPRLNILKRLLKDDGSIWISIDDNENAYLRILLDEVFGRQNFITTIIWRKNYAPKSSAKHFSEDHDYIIVYAKDANKWRPNLMPRTDKQDKAYKNPDNDSRGPWRPNNLAARNYYSKGTYSIKSPGGRIIQGPPPGSYWRVSEEKFWAMDRDNRIWWGKDGNNVPAPKIFLSEVKQGTVPQTFWSYEDVGHTQDAKKEIISLFGDDVFSTPKPEKLIQRIFMLGSNENETVLDSFLGSGTSAAVAHKMRRKWIGIELGEHANTHCLPRLKKVVSGIDKGGITETVDWQGGGGFKFYSLAPSLIKKDKFGSDIINPEYNATMLAAAMAKQEGFRYAPDDSAYWKQGSSSEKDFIFTTTQFITVQILDRLAEELKPGESLLICCKSFAKGCTHRHRNITIKKIPQMLLGRCEFGKDDYSLNIVNLPTEDESGIFEPQDELLDSTNDLNRPKKNRNNKGQSTLF